MRGAPISARAMEQRCFCPPETSCGRRPATSVRRKRSSCSPMRRTRSTAGEPRGAELEILPQRHVRKQRVVLQDVAAVALARWTVDAGGAVEQHPVVEHDAPRVGPDESGDGVERQRLAGAARAEQHRHPARGLQFNMKLECTRLPAAPEALVDRQPDHPCACLGPRRFATQSSTSAVAEMISTKHAGQLARCPPRRHRRWPPPPSASGPGCCRRS